ncbi:hypothetical protein VCHC47A1_1402, partial [Vibrio cholerae HC-47A1]
METRFGAGGG